MIKQIDLFMPPLSQYGVLHYFTKQMAQAFTRLGVGCRILEAERNNPRPFLEKLFGDKPDCTLSFNGLLPDDQGRFFCDLIHIPHVACLVDSPNNFLDLIKSPLTIITCVDRGFVDFFQGMNFSRALFMPHGADASMPRPDPQRKFHYEVVVLSSCIDYEKNRAAWPRKYSPLLAKAIEEAAEITLSDDKTSYVQALVRVIDTYVRKPNGPDPTKIDFVSILDDLEFYIKGKDRVELVRAVKDAPVDIFGSPDGTANWKKYLGQTNTNIRYHDPVPFEQALDIMSQSKVLLNSGAWVKNGSHERVFSGIASGALVITNSNPYISQEFKDGESLAFYTPGNWEAANGIVNRMLHDDEKRNQIVEKGYQIVMAHHTWDMRAAKLLEEIEPILKSLA